LIVTGLSVSSGEEEPLAPGVELADAEGEPLTLSLPPLSPLLQPAATKAKTHSRMNTDCQPFLLLKFMLFPQPSFRSRLLNALVKRFPGAGTFILSRGPEPQVGDKTAKRFVNLSGFAIP